MDTNRIRKNIALFPFLYFASMVYRIITDIRNIFYNFRIFKVHEFNVPIISVGNITAGGTGKTPFILYLIEKMQGEYKNIAVVSRGYGRDSKDLQIVSDGKGNIASTIIGGDEPVLIATKFSNIPVIVSEKRSNGIKHAINQFNADLVLLDDAFQHRNAGRNCDIVLVDANNPVQNEKILPLGNLREKKSNLNRADIIMITKIEKEDSISEQVNYYKNYNADVYLVKFVNSRITQVNSDSEVGLNDLKTESFVAFSGIANPETFLKSLKEYGVNVKKSIMFKDHQKYSGKDIKLILSEAYQKNCKNIITTEKDLVKLNVNDFDNYNLFISEMKIEVKNEENFFKKVQNCID
jgi:tetraacyldisaccharide 4'-kinase